MLNMIRLQILLDKQMKTGCFIVRWYIKDMQFFFWKKLCRAHDIISRAHDLLSRAHDLLSRAHDLLSRTHDILSCAHDIICVYKRLNILTA